MWRITEIIFWMAVLWLSGQKLWPQAAAILDIGSAEERRPSLVMNTLAGEILSLESLRGQVVLVNFWATWCPPCRVEMPGFERVYSEKREQGFMIVGLSTDRAGQAAVQQFVSERGITFPIAMASDAMKQEFGGIPGLPTSFLIDRDGRVRHMIPGILAEPTLRVVVDRLLAEQSSAEQDPLAPTAPK